MDTYYVKTRDIPSLQDALGRMIGYAMFMAKESGFQDRIDYVNQILTDDDIEVEVENNDSI